MGGMANLKRSIRRVFPVWPGCLASVLGATLLFASPAAAQGPRNPFAEALEGPGEESFAEGEEEHLETDRDSFTPATTVVGRGRTILEGSYSFVDNANAPDHHSYPEFLARVGVNDWFELRLGGNYETGGPGAISGAEVGGDEEEGPESTSESNVLYGFKVAVTTQIDWLPRSAFIAHATTPTSGPNSATQFVTGYVFGWTLPNKWELDSSLRYVDAEEEGDHFNQWAPSVVLKVPVCEQWNVHAEYFGIFTENREDEANPQYVSPGIHYLVTPDCEVGVRVGWGLNEDAANFFSNVGVGARF
jgi:hypothetical protein